MSDLRSLAVALPLVVPWTVLLVPDVAGVRIDLVFAWGLLDPDTLSAVSIAAYLFEHTSGLPEYLLAWPTSVGLYALGGASVFGRVVAGREDRRLTSGLFVLAGLSHLSFATGVGTQNGLVAVPVATALLWLLAWWNRPDELLR